MGPCTASILGCGCSELGRTDCSVSLFSVLGVCVQESVLALWTVIPCLVFWFGDHIWKCSGLLPCSVLIHHSQQSLGDQTWGIELGSPTLCTLLSSLGLFSSYCHLSQISFLPTCPLFFCVGDSPQCIPKLWEYSIEPQLLLQ